MQPCVDYINACMRAVLQICLYEDQGDILVFLPGQEQIEEAHLLIAERVKFLNLKCQICPLYANLPPQEQVKVFHRTPIGVRKIVLSTNIAETSITIPGVRFVVDSGLVK